MRNSENAVWIIAANGREKFLGAIYVLAFAAANGREYLFLGAIYVLTFAAANGREYLFLGAIYVLAFVAANGRKKVFRHYLCFDICCCKWT